MNCLKNLLRRIPLFGQLVDARWASIRSSFYELLVGTVFSTLPIWFFPIFVSHAITGSPSMGVLMTSSIERADLFIYSAALIGPLIYSITKDYAEVRDDEATGTNNRLRSITFKFPYGSLFFVFSIVVCMIAAFCYGISLLSTFPASNISISSGFLVKSSIFVYGFSLACLFTVSVYRNELEDLNKDLSSDERDFMKKWKQRG